MIISLDIVLIYLVMVLFGLFAYAYIIPYFVVRRIRTLVETGWLSHMLGALIPQLVAMKIILKDAKGEEHEVPMVNYLVSIAIDNLKMQLNSLKSAMVRGIIGGDGEGGGELMDSLLENVPKKWRWVVQMFAPAIMAKVAVQGNAPGVASGAKYGGA